MIAARASERRPQLAQGGRLGIPRAGLPRRPGLLAVEVDQRAEQHVFLEPPALGLDEPREGRLARRAGGRLGHLVARERGRERFGLRVPHVRVGDPRGVARRVEREPRARRERIDATRRREVLDRVQGEIEGIEGERA